MIRGKGSGLTFRPPIFLGLPGMSFPSRATRLDRVGTIRRQRERGIIDRGSLARGIQNTARTMDPTNSQSTFGLQRSTVATISPAYSRCVLTATMVIPGSDLPMLPHRPADR